MDDERRFLLTAHGLGLAAVVHGALTWGPVAVARFVVVAVVVAFVAELVVVSAGLLEHHTGTQVAGVPLAALVGWVGAIYLSYRVALLFSPAETAPLVAAGLATATNVLSDPRGVDDGFWRYPPSPVSSPRYAAVPWWNFVGWFVFTAAVTWLATPG